VVSTLYRSREFLQSFLDEVLQAVAAAGFSRFEIVLVNDGSPDDSLAYALSRKQSLPELVIVDLSRNFGHHQAAQVGLRYARGELIFLIDCDMEVRPAILSTFREKMSATSCDAVFAYQEARNGGLFQRLTGWLFWKGFNALSDVRIPENICTERLLTRRFVDAFLTLGDHNLFLGGMMSWTGFSQIGVAVTKVPRTGASAYGILDRLKLMVNAVSAFSSRPLTWLFYIGVSITAVSAVMIVYLIARKLLFDDALLGFTSIMAMLVMSLGIMTTSIGTLGIYLGKVFNQVQQRPNVIVRDVYR
jgi:putative glycosyltransferase